MLNLVKKIQCLLHPFISHYSHLCFNMICMSGLFFILCDSLWSATIFLPISVGTEILAKFLISHAIERLAHH